MNKSILLMAAFAALISAFALFYFQPDWILANKFSDKTLYGHLTSFELSEVAMRNDQGEPVTWKNFADKPLYITAGFTACPNACPITMSHYQRLATRLKQRAFYSMLTIDPERDTAKVLRAYLKNVNKDIFGLIVDEQRLLNQVTEELKQSVFIAKSGQPIIHKGHVYLVHPKVQGLIVYDQSNLDIEKMVADFILLEGGSKDSTILAKNTEA